eukprot:gene27056-33287_t
MAAIASVDDSAADEDNLMPLTSEDSTTSPAVSATSAPTAVAADGPVACPEWPVLEQGASDIFFMSKLQAALEAAGYWCGEDCEDMLFQAPTVNALATFQ